MNTTQYPPSPASRAGTDLSTNIQAVSPAVGYVRVNPWGAGRGSAGVVGPGDCDGSRVAIVDGDVGCTQDLKSIHILNKHTHTQTDTDTDACTRTHARTHTYMSRP